MPKYLRGETLAALNLLISLLESHITDFYLKGRRRKTGRESDDLWGRRRRRLCSIWEEVDYKVSYSGMISLPLVALEKGLTKSLGFSDFTQAVDWRTQCLPLAQVSPRMDRPGEAFNRSQPVHGSTHSRTGHPGHVLSTTHVQSTGSRYLGRDTWLYFYGNFT